MPPFCVCNVTRSHVVAHMRRRTTCNFCERKHTTHQGRVLLRAVALRAMLWVAPWPQTYISIFDDVYGHVSDVAVGSLGSIECAEPVFRSRVSAVTVLRIELDCILDWRGVVRVKRFDEIRHWLRRFGFWFFLLFRWSRGCGLVLRGRRSCLRLCFFISACSQRRAERDDSDSSQKSFSPFCHCHIYSPLVLLADSMRLD